MTPKERAAQRRAEEKAKVIKFPGADLIRRERDYAVRLILRAGEPAELKIGRNGEWPIDNGSWKYSTIPLDVENLSELIHALVCRYNAMVDKANSLAKEAAMRPLRNLERGHKP